jgi:hypothetical protein
MNPSFDWTKVLSLLDNPSTNFFDHNSVAIVLKASKAVLKDISHFPINVFLNHWKNKTAQIQFLYHAIQIAPEIFTFQKLKKVVGKESFVINNTTRFFVNGCLGSCWNLWDLISLLVEYSASATGPLLEACNRLLDLGLEQAPELLLLGFAQIEVWSQFS